MDPGIVLSGPLVVTSSAEYTRQPGNESAGGHTDIGGLVLDKNGQPVAGAWLRLEPVGQTSTSALDGTYVMYGVPLGSDYTLRARAVGFAEAQRLIDVPSLTGEYNLQFA
jgi:hypothetical protein